MPNTIVLENRAESLNTKSWGKMWLCGTLPLPDVGIKEGFTNLKFTNSVTSLMNFLKQKAGNSRLTKPLITILSFLSDFIFLIAGIPMLASLIQNHLSACSWIESVCSQRSGLCFDLCSIAFLALDLFIIAITFFTMRDTHSWSLLDTCGMPLSFSHYSKRRNFFSKQIIKYAIFYYSSIKRLWQQITSVQ